jgi:hypothetical protein
MEFRKLNKKEVRSTGSEKDNLGRTLAYLPLKMSRSKGIGEEEKTERVSIEVPWFIQVYTRLPADGLGRSEVLVKWNMENDAGR